MNKSGLLGASRLIEYISILLVAWGLVLCASAAVAQSVFDLNSASGAAAIQYDEDGLVLRKTLLQSQTIGAAYLTADYWNVLDASGAIACSVDLSSSASAGTMRIKGIFSPSQTLSPAAGDLWQLKNGNGNYVLILDSGGNLKISGILSENATWTTQYNQFSFGIPVDTPENGVVAQIMKGAGASAKELEISKVETIVGGVTTTAPNNWFEVAPMGNGNYNLQWKAPAGVNLASYEGIAVTVNKVENQTSSFDQTVQITVSGTNSNMRWTGIPFGTLAGYWQMSIPPYQFTALPGHITPSSLYAFEIDKEYTIAIQKTDTSGGTPIPDYIVALSFAGTAVNGWKAGVTNNYFAYDPTDILGNSDHGGSAQLFFADIQLTEASGHDPIYLAETATASTKEVLQQKLILSTPGLHRMIAAGLPETAADLYFENPPLSILGKVRVFDATDPDHLVQALDGTSNTGSMSLSAVGADDEVDLIVEGSAKGFGSLPVSLRLKNAYNGGVGVKEYTDSIGRFIFGMTVTWESINSPIDDNPTENGGGKRIFPDKPTPTYVGTRNSLKSRVTLDPPLSGISIYFKVLDVDDTTAGSIDPTGIIDTTSVAGEDNFGAAATLDSPIAVTNSSGQAEVTMTVGMQPGDNYRVGVAFESAKVSGLTINDILLKTHVLAEDDQKIGFNGGLSPLLTVWRRLWCEFDSMGPIPTTGPEKNFDDGIIDGIQPNVPMAGQTTIDMGRLLTDEEDRFVDGRIEITDIGIYSVISNTDNLIVNDHVVISGVLTSAVIGKNYKLYDDDQTSLPYSMSGEEVLENAFKQSYILPVRAPEEFEDFSTPFKRNVGDTNSEINQLVGINKDLLNSNDFWAVFMLTAFQGPPEVDSDPPGTAETSYGQAVDATNSGMIFNEPIKEIIVSPSNPRQFEKIVITHEIGHAGGAEHTDGYIMNKNEWWVHQTYAPITIKRFREEAEF